MQYSGGCHCGAVRYEVDMTIENVLSCNCSICSKKGTLLAFTPAENFKLIKGEEFLSDYQFNKKVIHHYFCKNCGIGSFAAGSMPDGSPMRAINVRCLDNIDIHSFPEIKHDGLHS
jgi:hypothetical protein